MARTSVTDDYYSILEVEFGASLQIVKYNYRRLALQVHPDKNPDNPTATARFQVLSAAYETLNDADKRRKYDQIWPSIRSDNRSEAAERAAHKRQAEAAAKAERKRAEMANAEAKARAKAATALQRQHEEEKLAWERQREVLRAKLSKLREEQSGYESSICELNRTRTKLNGEIKRLDELDQNDQTSDEAGNGWGSLFSKKETEEEKQRREADRIDREASRRIKLSTLEQVGQSLQTEEETNAALAAEIAQVRSELAESHAAEARKEAEWQEEARAQKARDIERERVAAEKRAQNQRAREERLRAQEVLARQRAEEYRARKRAEEAEAAEAERARRREAEAEGAEEGGEGNWRAANGRGGRELPDDIDIPMAEPPSSGDECRHKRYWKVVEGDTVCGCCKKPQRSAFQCPVCSVVACVACRVRLKRGNTARGERQRPAFR